jgi:hypothetical protein
MIHARDDCPGLSIHPLMLTIKRAVSILPATTNLAICFHPRKDHNEQEYGF